MPIQKLTRQQLELINRRTLGYPLHVAEKDYHLALAVHLVYRSELGKKLVFKGGTALHHCYLPQKRFSEDLDFTSIDPAISLEEIVSVLESQGFFQVNKVYQSKYTFKIEGLQYPGLLGQPGNIKIEVDHYQSVLLQELVTKYSNVWRIDTTPLVMDPREMCAEKLRAVSQRARYRDFYDLYFLIYDLGIDIEEVVEILKVKEIRSPITTANIIENWSIAVEQQASDLGAIYCSENLAVGEIEKLIKSIQFDDIGTSSSPSP
jgi:predicted nucleotidyltransferase component of viral defense system